MNPLIPQSSGWQCMNLFSRNKGLFTDSVRKVLQAMFPGLEFGLQGDFVGTPTMKTIHVAEDDKEQLRRQLDFFIAYADLFSLFTGEHEAECRAAFQEVAFFCDEKGVLLMLDIRALSEDQLSQLSEDLQFFRRNRKCHPKYLFSRMSNFKAQTKRQQTLFKIVENVNCVGRGYLLTGDAHTGKTRLVVALAKNWCKVDKEIYLLTPESCQDLLHTPVKANQIWIVAKCTMQTQDQDLAYMLRRVIWGTHASGSKLFLASDIPFGDFLGGCPDSYKRRAREQIGMVPSLAIHAPKEVNAKDEYTHSDDSIGELNMAFNHPAVTNAVQQEVVRNYPALRVQVQFDGVMRKVISKFVTEDEVACIIRDLNFFSKFPGIAIGNICSRLENYLLTSAQHKALYDQVMAFTGGVNLTEARGLYLASATGNGKSHLTIALAKVMMTQNEKLELFFVTPSGFDTFMCQPMDKNQVWILDDFDFHGRTGLKEASFFLRAVDNCCTNGGLLVVTSILPREQVLERALRIVGIIDEEECKEYKQKAERLFGGGLEAELADLKIE